MVSDEIDIFIRCIETYFEKRSEDKVVIETPYLTSSIARILLDLTGVISISGAYRGDIYFTAPKEFLENIILAHGQTDFNKELLEDAIGELSNTLSGNSRRDLGSRFVISVPHVIHGNASSCVELTEGAHSYVIPMKWKDFSAAMVVSVIQN